MIHMPNFIVIGAGKSGTSSLHYYLAQHPEIFVCPVKEPRFFAFDGARPGFSGPGDEQYNAQCVYELDKYRALFAGVTTERAVGEISPRYLRSVKAADAIKKYVPDAKLVAILRNPADRAYSSYLMKVRDGLETESFPEALRLEAENARSNWHWGDYAYVGYYFRHLKVYFDRFPRDQIRVCIFEEFIREPLGAMQDLFQFLDVDSTFVPDTEQRHNESGIIRNPVLRMLWHKSRGIRGWIRPYCPTKLRHAAFQRVIRNLVKQPVPPEFRAELLQRYKPDIEKLEDLLRRDLSIWLTDRSVSAPEPERDAEPSVQ